jgi:hypothetical protein
MKSLFSKIFKKHQTSQDLYFMNIPINEIDNWKLEIWKKDKVNELIKKDGFYLKPDFRAGSIYYSKNYKLCQIYFEQSGVKELDILIFFDQLYQWELPIREKMTEDEKKLILEKLKIWLNEKKLKSDIYAIF